MQLIAEKEGKKIWAHEANRGENYICTSCGYAVRKRGGYLKRAHFYHIYAGPKCQGEGKSLQHLQTQMWISHLFRNQTIAIEHSFPQLGRIADVYWPNKQIVFEIQYSAISFKEMAARNHDYASIGIYTVWILHTHMFKPTLHLERNLKGISHYYTNINAEGRGYIFDQFYTDDGPTHPFLVNLSKAKQAEERPRFLPKCLNARFKTSKYFFDGDIIDQAQRTPYILPVLRHKRPSPYRKLIHSTISQYNT